MNRDRYPEAARLLPDRPKGLIVNSDKRTLAVPVFKPEFLEDFKDLIYREWDQSLPSGGSVHRIQILNYKYQEMREKWEAKKNEANIQENNNPK